MICTDVQSMARAAPEPVTSTPKVSYGDAGNSFDQFLQAVTSESSTGSDSSIKTRSSERETKNDDYQSENERSVDSKSTENKSAENKSVDQKSVNEKQVDKKPAEEKKTDDLPADQEKVQTDAVDGTVQEAIAAALAAQMAAIAVPVQQTDVAKDGGEMAETTIPQAAVPVMQNQQSTVIQLPETEPQSLPDELKQSIQQPKVEVKDFQTLVDAASQNLEKQAATTETQTKVAVTAAANQVAESTDVKPLTTQEPAIKVVDLTVESDDMAQLDKTQSTSNVYALTTAKTENLVQPKSLPIIEKVSTEVAELVRQNGQSLRIQIHPENMGKIDLRLVSNSDGMKVVMTAEVPATAKLLESHMDQLQRSLANAGVSISGMSVNSQGAQGQSDTASQSQQGLARISVSTFQPEAELISPVAVQVSSSGLDYRI